MPLRGERAIRFLLGLYPAEFRARYGEDLVRCSADQYADLRARGGSHARFWAGALSDLGSGAVRARWDHLFDRRRSAIAVGMGVGGGALATGAAVYCFCCLLPSMLGPTGRAVAADLYGFRTPLLTMSVLLLGAGLWVAYRHESFCVAPVTGPRGSAKLSRASVWAGTGVWIVALFAPTLEVLLHHRL